MLLPPGLAIPEEALARSANANTTESAPSFILRHAPQGYVCHSFTVITGYVASEGHASIEHVRNSVYPHFLLSLGCGVQCQCLRPQQFTPADAGREATRTMWGTVAGIAGKGAGFAGQGITRAVNAASYVGEARIHSTFLSLSRKLFEHHAMRDTKQGPGGGAGCVRERSFPA